jgi:glycine cleavage system H protein
MYPTDCLYTEEHEWIRKDGDLYVIGITDFAQKELGEVVYIELPEVGTELEAHDSFGTIESVKAVSELFSPAAGEVVEINDAAVDGPEVINDDPHGDGWLVKMRLSSDDDLKSLMKAEQYEEHVSGEG